MRIMKRTAALAAAVIMLLSAAFAAAASGDDASELARAVMAESEADRALEQKPAVHKKAEYLDFKNPYLTVLYTPREKFLEFVQEDAVRSPAGGDLRRIVYGDSIDGSEHLFGAEFLVTQAGKCDLIEAGTFIRTRSCHEQLVYLTGTNGFEQHWLLSCTEFSGNECTAEKGDTVFWLNDGGFAVNAGIVVDTGEKSIDVAVYNIDTGAAVITLDREAVIDNLLGAALIVKTVYPYYEHLTFMFIYDEMKLTPAVAAGIMASIYCESEFVPYREESSGYGYGICQWSEVHRRDMVAWCAANGYDSSCIFSQLRYLKHDLEVNDPDLIKAYRAMGNTSIEAYEAGISFCKDYEGPSGGAGAAEGRGDLARFNFFNAYSGHPYM